MAVEFTAAEIVETAENIEMIASQAALTDLPVGVNTIVVKDGAATVPLDPVEEAGRESFPASDPPAWTGSAIG